MLKYQLDYHRLTNAEERRRETRTRTSGKKT